MSKAFLSRLLAPALAMPTAQGMRRARILLILTWLNFLGGVIACAGYIFALHSTPLPITLHLAFYGTLLLTAYTGHVRLGLAIFLAGAAPLHIVAVIFYDLTSLLYLVTSFTAISTLLDSRTHLIYAAGLLGLTLLIGLATAHDPRYAGVTHSAAVMFTFIGLVGTAAVTRVFIGDLKQINEQNIALRQTEERLREAQRVAHIGSWDFDAATGRFDGSDELYRILGLEPGTPLNAERAAALLHPDDVARCRATLDMVTKNGGQAEIPVRIVRPDGTLRHVWSRILGVLRPDGALARLHGTLSDVTTLRQTEAALGERVRFIERMMALSPNVLFVFELEDVAVTYCNDAVQTALGYSPQEIMQYGRALLYMLAVTDEIPDMLVMFQQCKILEDNQVLERDLPLVHRDGTIRRLQVRFSPFTRRADGEVASVVGTAIDVTEPRQTLHALQRSERRYNNLLRAFPDIIFRMNTDGTFLDYWSNSEALYVPAAQIVGRNVRALLPESVAAQTIQAIEAALRQDTPQTFQYQLDMPGMGVQTYEARIVAQDQQEVLAVARNISRLHALYEQQRILSARLEQVNQSLSQFAHTVSHDLKAPLRGILTVAEWLAADYRGAFDESGGQLLELLAERARRMESMIEGILQYSRLGYETSTPTEVDMQRLVEELVELIVPPNIQATIETPLPIVQAEPVRLRQVFQNLLDNAVKYMGKPQGRIGIGGTAQDDMWQFYVTDDGIGIESRHFERIFHLFHTLATKDERASSGIGLAIVKRIVELYGGNVWVTSTLGSGSTFYFTLPKGRTP